MGSSSSDRSFWWALPVFFFLAFVVFWPVLWLNALSDDHSALWHSALHGEPWRNGFFRPLSDLSFRSVYLLGGRTPVGQRVFNIALHAANTYLVFALFKHLTGSADARSSLGAWCAALLFLIYPFHQESIVWLVGRESSLGTFFVLLGLLGPIRQRPAWLGPILACTALFVGPLCYESALLLPLMMVVIGNSNGATRRVAARTLLAFFLVTLVAYVLFRLLSSGTWGNSYLTGMVSSGLPAILTNIPKAMARLILPPMEPSLFVWMAVAALLLVFTLGIVVKRSMRQQPMQQQFVRMMLLLVMIASILPIIGGVSTRTSESDRFLYMPSAFLCMLIGSLVVRVARRPVRVMLFAALFIASALALSMNHAHWREASATTTAVIEQLPAARSGSRVFIAGLPDSREGAFIFRNGFVEAVHLSGRDGSQYVPVPTDAQHEIVHFRGEDIVPGPGDRWIRWTGSRFQQQ